MIYFHTIVAVPAALVLPETLSTNGRYTVTKRDQACLAVGLPTATHVTRSYCAVSCDRVTCDP